MHTEEAEAEPDSTLITGRIYIAGVATNALLDSGATHSFISESFVKRLGIMTVAMDSGFRVSIPSGDQMFTSRIVRGLELRLQQKAVRADLIVLPLPEFDIILGMDWLSSHGAVIDFRQRSVSVRPPSGKPFVFEAARHQQFPHVISCMCARKIIKRGCQAFLASIVSVSEPVSQRLEDVDVVSEFSSVLPDDVSGIPPDREVEFSIELMAGTMPIYKAPYRLAPAEMKELKDQIQDLLDKGFVRPSFSPWGAPVLFVKKKDGSMRLCIDYRELNRSREEHSHHLRTILQTLQDRRLYAKFSKCYYRKFIKGFSSIAVPMTALTKKNAKFVWGPECQESFDRLKQALTTAPVLAMPSGQGEFVVYTDASKLVYARGEAPNLATLTVQPTLRDRIRAGQTSDEQLQKWRQIDETKGQRLYAVVDGIVRYRDRLWVPDSDSLRADILSEAHSTPYSIHPGSTEMYKDLQSLYWWPGMKRDILRQTADLVAKIRDRMRTAQSRQKSYADQRRRDLEFAVGDHVFVKVAPMKGVMRFGKKGKLSPRFIGPFEILERVGTLAYRVALPPSLSGVHNVFHVSMLRKYMSNPSHVLNYEPLQLTPHLSFEERPTQILDRQEKRLRNKVIQMVKVKWLNHSEEEATWETETEIRSRYPELFGTF
ncbi:uncharacterized protein [Primulina eburnea]|uniref:uncharacterized protein n=1 Tax=Primulina eburnea TaxID=1245227 RepID=UPI003C6C36BE